MPANLDFKAVQFRDASAGTKCLRRRGLIIMDLQVGAKPLRGRRVIIVFSPLLNNFTREEIEEIVKRLWRVVEGVIKESFV